MQLDDSAAVLKVAAYFVSHHHSNLEFIPPSQHERRPDIKIRSSEIEIFLEIKLLTDTSKWGSIQDSLRGIPSGLLVNIQVDFELYPQHVERIINDSRNALRNRNPNTLPPSIDLEYATITFLNSPDVPANSTQVAISSLDAWRIVGDQDYTDNTPEVTYSDIRRIFENRLDEAIPQLSSVEGCRVVVFDVEWAQYMRMGGHDLLVDAFRGTPTVGGREDDALFANSASSIDAVVTFVGEQPDEAVANPNGRHGRCLSLLGLNGLEASE